VKILDEKSRLFGIINPVDLLLVVVVLAVVVIVASVLFPNVSPTKPAAKDVVKVTILAGGLRAYVPGSIRIGDPINRKTGGKMGKVVAIDAVPSTFEEPTAAGTLKKATSTVFTDLYVTIEGVGQINPGVSAFMGDEQVRTNQDIDFQAPTFEAVKAKVLEITGKAP
jgi:hypothetical protein